MEKKCEFCLLHNIKRVPILLEKYKHYIWKEKFHLFMQNFWKKIIRKKVRFTQK